MTTHGKERQTPGMLTNWIDGAAQPPAGGEFLEDYNPATGEVNAWIPRSNVEDVNAAVLAAQAALRGPWGNTSTDERADYLDAIAAAIEARKDELAALESQDTGKPVSLAASVDIPRAIANFRFFAGAVRHATHPMHPMADAINYSHRKPVGVVGLITPWNLPLYLLTWKTAPALAMGNAIIAKPSEVTPLTAAVLAEIISEVGVPPGVFNLLHGYGHEAGQAMVEHPGVKAISFTGGTSTGAKVAATGAPMFKKLSLELGGKNPTIVFADCDFDVAVAGAVRAGFANQGQVCLCGSRLLVERSIYEHFVASFVDGVRAIKVGDPADPATNMGSLVSQEHRTKVERCIGLAREEGGVVLYGGSRPILDPPFDRGAFLNPTVIVGLGPQCRSVQEEIFGPVVTIHPFDTDDEALAMANNVPYGLAASVWTKDLQRAHRFSEALDVGMVWVNTWLQRDLRVPFGGVKDSGVGREGGRYSLEFFSEVSNICINLGRPRGFAPDAPLPLASGQTAMLASPAGRGAAKASVAAKLTPASLTPAALPPKKDDTDAELAAVDGRTMAYTEGIDEAVLAALAADPSATVDYLQVASSLGIERANETHTLDSDQPTPVDPSVVRIGTNAHQSAAFPHARRVGDLLFLSGVGPHNPKTDAIVGGPTHNSKGEALDYHFSAQALAVIENIRIVLEAAGSSLEKIVDVTVFLVDMKRDLEAFEQVYGDYFSKIQATRTVVAVQGLSTPVAIECKVVAKA